MSNQKLSFEEAVAALEDIIGKMESGNMPLEESIEYFKKGTELIKHCDKILDKYEKMITIVTPDADGEVKEEEV
ncbi:MAG: exodeoxyribonuclease VII small subunit [Ruminococcaceae bacterium]|nr:exodeoxyribonuclease VII small subunit [Oscillospiraceae bacterium]